MMPEMPVLQQAVNLKFNDGTFLSALICATSVQFHNQPFLELRPEHLHAGLPRTVR
jgi:hypothetical protein